MKKVSRYIAAAILSLVVCRSNVFAMPIVFDITGQFDDGASLSGTLTIDTLTGLATAANLSVSAPVSLDFTVVDSQGPISGDSLLRVQNGLTVLFLILPEASLVNYAGGHLCTANDLSGCGGQPSVLFNSSTLVSGSAAPSSDTPAVPEPATLILVGSGVLGIVAKWRPRAAPAQRSQPFLD